MRQIERRVLGVLTLGGGFLGLTLVLSVLMSSGQSLSNQILLLPFVALYCWGIQCGVLLLESHRRSLRASRLFWILQIPYFMSPIGGFFFANGLFVCITIRPFESGGNFLARLGSQFEVSLLQPDKPFEIGINLVAIAVVVYLGSQLRRASLEMPAEPKIATSPDEAE